MPSFFQHLCYVPNPSEHLSFLIITQLGCFNGTFQELSVLSVVSASMFPLLGLYNTLHFAFYAFSSYMDFSRFFELFHVVKNTTNFPRGRKYLWPNFTLRCRGGLDSNYCPGRGMGLNWYYPSIHSCRATRQHEVLKVRISQRVPH
jgi:hypothetical protein